MTKSTTMIYYATDSDAAKARAARIRDEGKNAQVRQTTCYDGEAEPCDAVVVLPDVSDSDRARIEEAYGDKVARVAKPKLTLPPPPPSSGKSR